jgi:hypothetical protein
VSNHEDKEFSVSDLYELGFTLELKPDLSQEVIDTLLYMTRSGGVSAEAPRLEHPFFHIQGFSTEWTYLISNPREDDEEILGGACGSIFTNNHLKFRGLIHEDPFWNTWEQFKDWLSSISSTTGLIGYYRNINYDDQVILVSFQSEGVCEIDCDDPSELEELQNQIIENLENSVFEPPVIRETQSLGELAKAKGYLVMRVPGLGIIELLRPSQDDPTQMVSVARSSSEEEIRQAIEQEL